MIRISKVCGCCSGAKCAIDKALELSETNDKVYVYKEILHNKNVIEMLKKKGIKCVDNIEEARDGILVIRAHGESKETYDFLDKNGYKYVDATCVNVLRIHDIIKERYNDGYSIIIIGKKNHPEVIGSNGWCSNQAFIIEEEPDIEKLNISNDKILVICQTTFNKEKAGKYIEQIKNKYPNVEVVNSICNASVTIQKYSLELAKEVDIMLVIGGKNSSNTKELYNIVSSVTTSYMISSKEELISLLKEIKINKDTNIGITAGASTMKSEIEEYVDIINFYIDYSDVVKKCKSYQELFNDKMSDDKNEIVRDSLEQLSRMNSSGKYIRAYLISLAYHLFGKSDDDYLALSNAYELFQTSILIHDDIIDDATKRRGKDTIPVYYKNKYNSNSKKLGNDLAVCIADYGFYYANKALVQNYKDNKYLNDVLLEFNDIVLNTIKGEILDVELPHANIDDKELEEQIFNIYSLKTSWYTILGPFRLGMILSGSNVNTYDDLLHDLGICFQIKDDILGVFGDSNNIGKTLSDITEGKQTILYSYAINNKTYKDELLKYYGRNNSTIEECEKVKEIFIVSGALDYAKRKENELFDKILKKIDIIDVDNRYKSILKGFMYYLQHRDK